MLLCFSSCTVIQTAQVPSVHELEGRWISQTYLTTLRATKSPIHALDHITVPLFDIGTKDHDSYWSILYNFHDGATLPIKNIQATSKRDTFFVDVIPAYSSDKSKNYLVYSYSDKDRLTWILDDGVSSTVEQYVRKDSTFSFEDLVLNGTYTDSLNRLYEFNNHTAKWPKKVFNYDLGLDHVEIRCDYLEVLNDTTHNGSPLRYGFKITNGDLSLYNLHRDQEGIELLYDSLPFLMLKTRK